MALVEVHGYSNELGWIGSSDGQVKARHYCAELEAGNILYFPGVPFDLPDADRARLLEKRQSGLRFHKNISYRPKTGELRGFDSTSPEDTVELQRIMKKYSAQVVDFVEKCLTPYSAHYTLDYASYRPNEEAGRDLSLHKRNDLLHVDAFPSRPTAGGRILRVFTNINPTRARSWIVSDPFEKLAAMHAQAAGLDRVARRSLSTPARLWRRSGAVIRLFGGASARTAYDIFMLHFHDWLKENSEFQKNCPKTAINFPPGSTWLVYTDQVPHAVLTGQFALEQTFIVHLDGMVTPEHAPINVLERLSRRRLAA